MKRRTLVYDDDFETDMKTFLRLIERNKFIVKQGLTHKCNSQLFSIAVRRLIVSYNTQHANDKPLSRDELTDLIKEVKGVKPNATVN